MTKDLKYQLEVVSMAERLTTEKFEYLEKIEKEMRAEGADFDFDVEQAVWYTLKIAELYLKLGG